MQAQLQELESKILAHVAEMQGKSAREAAASLGRTLQKEGVIGVTEEVRNYAPGLPQFHTHTALLPGEHTLTLPAPCYVPGPKRHAGGSDVCFGAGMGGWRYAREWRACLDSSVVQAEEGSAHVSLAPSVGGARMAKSASCHNGSGCLF